MSASVVKMKSINNQDGPSKGKSVTTSITKKKIESSTKQQPADTKNKSASKPVKSEVKANVKTITSPAKTTAKTTTTPTKREKKVYSLPGQKYDPPEEREPLRIFYESLSEQIPSSEMAEFWLMEHGLLSPERAKKAYEKKQRKQKQIRTGTPIKSPAPPRRPESSPKQQAAKNGVIKPNKRPVNDSDDEYITSPKRRKA